MKFSAGRPPFKLKYIVIKEKKAILVPTLLKTIANE